MGGVSIFRLLRPLVLIPLVPILVLVLAMMTPVMFPIWALGLVLFVVPSFRESMPVSILGYFLFGLWWLVLLVVVAVPLLAVVFIVGVYVHARAPQALH